MSLTNAISIYDILQRQAQLEWYESVAIVAELCSVHSSNDPTSPIPQPEDILIRSDGSLVVQGRTGEDSITALARLLNALLAGSTPPAPLRLFVLHSISSATHKSSKTFGEALAYYERPGRQQLIQAAYHRYFQTPEDAPQIPRPPLVVEEEKKQVPPKKARRKQKIQPWVAVVAMLLAVMAAIAVWASTTGAAADPANPTADAAANVGANVGAIVAKVGEAARSITTVVRDQLGLRTPEPEPEPQPVKTVAARPPSRRPAALPSIPAEPPADESHVVVTGEEIIEPSVAADNSAEEVIETPFGAGESQLYSNGSADVQPPVLLDPQRPPASVRIASETVANAMEMIITETGSVERVKMLTPPQRLPDMMLLSAAKSWKFEPATRDGHPVRYRLTFNWVTPLR